MKRNKKGFTLIELLAVIVILAIIALIAVPVIMNIINSANKSAFKDTAYGIISAGELYFAERQLDINGMTEAKTFTLPSNELEIKGEVPEGTTLKVNTKGQVALSTSNGRYCITKRYEDTDITVTEDAENCYFPYSLRAIVTETEDLEVNECLTNGETCAAGTQFAIKVNNTDTYKFRVLKDEDDVVTLIMSSNLGDPVAWFNREDHVAIVGSDDDWCDEWNDCGNNSFGPITALRALKTRTSNWTNLEEYSYTLVDTNGSYADYSGEYVQNIRARLPKLSDEVDCPAGSTTCSAWIYDEFGDNHYWLSDASEVGIASYMGLAIDGGGYPIEYETLNDYLGIRPVIELSK